MYTRDIEIKNNTGLHARPASAFVRVAAKFKSNITVSKDSKKANAKSIMSVLTLGASKGSTVSINAEGPDEQEAVIALCDLIESRFGEE